MYVNMYVCMYVCMYVNILENNNPSIFSIPQTIKNLTSPHKQTKSPP